MMRISNFIAGILTALALASCSTKQSLPSQNAIPDSPRTIDVKKSDDTTVSTDSSMKVDTSKSIQPVNTVKDEEISYLGEQAIIYKTKNDYSRNVPVTMNADKSKIISYPTPKDVYRNGKLATPVQLKDGFLLDNRGISPNSVFLKITYDEYSRLNEAPMLNQMIEEIIDKDPITEIYSLGTRSRFKDEVNEINDIIQRGALKKFKKIK